MTHSGSTGYLGVGKGRHLLRRTVVLRGRRSAKPYLYAESLLVPGRLPDVFFRRLETTVDPIGRILAEEGIAFTRIPLPGPDKRKLAVDGDACPPPDGCPLARAYRVDVAGVPVMVITEWFLSAVQSLQDEW
jgi:chorismate-pyruvate lyase